MPARPLECSLAVMAVPPRSEPGPAGAGVVSRLRQSARAKLDHGARLLAEEFDSLPRQVVAREVDAIAEELLLGARFDDYIPVLVQRIARDHLRERQERAELLRLA